MHITTSHAKFCPSLLIPFPSIISMITNILHPFLSLRIHNSLNFERFLSSGYKSISLSTTACCLRLFPLTFPKNASTIISFFVLHARWSKVAPWKDRKGLESYISMSSSRILSRKVHSTK